MKWETLWTVACLLFASLPKGQPDATCHAFVGESVILPCTTTSPSELDVSHLMLFWQIESNIVHFFHNGEDQLTFQNANYSGRTSLFLDQIDLALWRHIPLMDRAGFPQEALATYHIWTYSSLFISWSHWRVGACKQGSLPPLWSCPQQEHLAGEKSSARSS